MECNYFYLDHEVAARQGKRLRYDGPEEAYRGKEGVLEVAFDENCCAPTQEQRYIFRGEGFFWMMTGEELEGELPFFFHGEEGK